MTKSLVTFLLDRSQSMSNIKSATIEAFNTYVSELQQDKGDGADFEFTFLQFDSQSLDKVHLCVPIKDVPMLNNNTFQPRGSTPLIDSCMQTINALEAALAKRDDKPKVIVCFQTDGEENCSREFTMQQLKAKIEEMTGKGWQFNFMGAGVDAYANAQAMGINVGAAMSYNSNDTQQTKAAFASTASNARGFATGALKSTLFSNVQRESAGDMHARRYGFVLDKDKTDANAKVKVTPPTQAIDLTKTQEAAIGKALDLSA